MRQSYWNLNSDSMVIIANRMMIAMAAGNAGTIIPSMKATILEPRFGLDTAKKGDAKIKPKIGTMKAMQMAAKCSAVVWCGLSRVIKTPATTKLAKIPAVKNMLR